MGDIKNLISKHEWIATFTTVIVIIGIIFTSFGIK